MPGFGGEGETRTPAPVTRPTPLAGAPRHQLEYFSMVTKITIIHLFAAQSKIKLLFYYILALVNCQSKFVKILLSNLKLYAGHPAVSRVQCKSRLVADKGQ